MLLLSPAFCWAKPLPEIRVVYYSYPPHVFQGPKGLQGAAVDVWERISKRAGYEIRWVGPIPFRRAQYMLEKGEVDAIIRLSKSPERESKFIFGKTSAMWGQQGITVLKSEPMKEIKSAEDLFGKTLGQIDGGVLPEFIKPHLDKIKMEPIPIDTVELNMTKLFRKRIWGVYFVFTDVARYYATKENRLNEIKFLKYPGSVGHKLSFIPMSRKADPEMVRRIFKAIDEEVPLYDYEKLSQKYIDEAAEKKP